MIAIYPHIENHRTTTNLKAKYDLLVANYKRLLEHHINYCGLDSSWYFRSVMYDAMLEQCKYIEAIKLRLIVKE